MFYLYHVQGDVLLLCGENPLCRFPPTEKLLRLPGAAENR